MPSACNVADVTGLFGALSALGGGAFTGVIEDALFYCSVREFVLDNIIVGSYRDRIASQLATALGFLSMVIVTLWVAVQGFQLLAGQGKQAAVPMLYRTGKLVLVLSLVTLLAQHSPVIVEAVYDFKDLIASALELSSSENALGLSLTALIDANLGITAMLSGINDSIRAVDPQRDSNPVTSVIGLLGQSGPAMLTATLMMLTELSITLAIMLSPLFLFFLIFQQTAQLFWSWAKFLLGALFSMAALTAVATIALQTTAIYGISVVAAFYMNSADGIVGAINGLAGGPFDINASSLRLAALGTLMTAIIVSVPPVIMGFFGGAAAFTTGAMVSMGGAGMLAQQLGAGKGAGMGTPALGAPQSSSSSSGPGQVGGGQALGMSAGGASSVGGSFSEKTAIANANRQAAEWDAGGGSSASVDRQARRVFHGLAPTEDQGGQAPQSGDGGGSAGLNTVQLRERELGQAQEMRPDPHTGVYRTAGADAAMARDTTLGRQGHLAPSGAGGGSGATGAGSSTAAGGGTGNGGNTEVGRTNPIASAAGNDGQHGGVKRPVGVPVGAHTQQAQQARGYRA